MTGRRQKAGLGCVGCLGSLLGVPKRRLDLGLLVGVYLQQAIGLGQFGRALLHPLLQKRRGLRLRRHVHDRNDETVVGQGMDADVEAHAVAPAEALLHRLAAAHRLEPAGDP